MEWNIIYYVDGKSYRFSPNSKIKPRKLKKRIKKAMKKKTLQELAKIMSDAWEYITKERIKPLN